MATPARRPGRLRGEGCAAFGDLLAAHPPSPLPPPAVVTPPGLSHLHAVTLAGVLSPSEAAAVIAETERRGYEPALVNVGGGVQMMLPGVRRSGRCIVDSPEFADALCHRLRGCLPQTYEGWALVGLNERLRFLRCVWGGGGRGEQRGGRGPQGGQQGGTRPASHPSRGRPPQLAWPPLFLRDFLLTMSRTHPAAAALPTNRPTALTPPVGTTPGTRLSCTRTARLSAGWRRAPWRGSAPG